MLPHLHVPVYSITVRLQLSHVCLNLRNVLRGAGATWQPHQRMFELFILLLVLPVHLALLKLVLLACDLLLYHLHHMVACSTDAAS